ncbi:hypothetical protein [Marinoscillum furvescens]|uniref:Lipoprotein n=1 Tax=Marinoscillum furvescens DSM 4134 TaxID=1122208 RepID=A0A3D9L2H5_MARFU|nr:hypothetical protein [Marinoscillum furvescens]RED96584.1 hypothetical protein C7460_11442 [Marinoscillum furvescens DSM 4134]
MKRTVLVTCIGLFIGISSCDEEPLELFDNGLEFGHSYGECIGAGCVVTYRLQSGKLYQIDRPSYAGCDQNVQLSVLPDSSFVKAKILLTQIPEQLWHEPTGNIGTPDAYDQGGIQISLSKDGEKRCWFIDTNNQATPDYLHHFIDSVQEVIQELP